MNIMLLHNNLKKQDKEYEYFTAEIIFEIYFVKWIRKFIKKNNSLLIQKLKKKKKTRIKESKIYTVNIF